MQSQQSGLVNTLVELAVVVGVAFAVYEWLKTQCSNPSSLLLGTAVCNDLSVLGISPASTGTSPTSPSSGTGTSPSNPPVQNPPPVYTAPPAPVSPVPVIRQPVQPAGTPPTRGPVLPPLPVGQTQLSVALQSLAGTSSLNADQWSYYLTQLTNGNALTGEQFTAAFPDRTRSITALAFVRALIAAGVDLSSMIGTSYGVGMLPGGPGIPASFIHSSGRGGYG